ncbi:MAG: ATP-grasp domain-containing protein [Firmicutes bacterium]|nr:ATP-grasp domain-containing protein [Bacillota bacterium]
MITKNVVRRAAKVNYYRILCKLLDPKNRGLDPYEDSPLKRRLTDMMPGRKNSAVYLKITGEVTGIGYAGWLWRKARVRDLDCKVYENSDGTVEAVIIGNGEDIEAVVLSAWKGSRRAKVSHISEHWFNKPVKSGVVEIKEEKQVSWSQGTADCIINTLDHIKSITGTPNEYPDFNKLVGTDELVRVAEERNVFYIRNTRKEVFFVSPTKTIGLQRSQTTRVPSMIHSLTDHKQLTKDFLQQYGLPVPEGKVFTDLKQAKAYLAEMNRPMVVKPAAGLNGSGVTVDVRTEEALETAWQYAKLFHERVVLEELVQGVDIRVVVIGGTARAALLRVPANVTGDGCKTIEQLVEEKNKLRLGNPRLSKNLIIADAYSDSYLERQGHSWESVPKKGEVVFLHLKANICKGADSISVTDFIHPDLMRLAEEAAAAFGINDYWGIDLLAESLDLPRDQQQCAIIELNSTANIENVIYPLYGPSFDSAKSFIDHLFPEDTKDSSYPVESLYVEVAGLLNEEFTRWVIDYARELSLRCFLRTGENSADIIISGYRHHVFNFLDKLWEWRSNDNGIFQEVVDGFQVHEYQGNIDSDDSAFISKPIRLHNYEAIQKTGLHTTEYPVNHYDSAHTEGGLNELNTKLFTEEFSRRGFDALPVYEDLLKISNGDSDGITAMRYSSLFCDRICARLYPAKKILALHKLPVARGVRLTVSKKKKALDYMQRIAKPCVVTGLHPVEYRAYKITNEEDLFFAWKKEKKRGTKAMLFEEFVEGFTVDIAVTADKFSGALVVEPTSLFGDGKSTIKQLIEERNELRKQNPWYAVKSIEIKNGLLRVLESQGKQVSDILQHGEKIHVESDVDLEFGGETVNISGILHEDFKQKAVQAVAAIPGLEFAIVQMRIPYPDLPAESQKWVINKIDTNPQVAMFHFPWRGQPVNLTGRVVAELCLSDRARWVEKGN